MSEVPDVDDGGSPAAPLDSEEEEAESPARPPPVPLPPAERSILVIDGFRWAGPVPSCALVWC